MEHTEEQKKGFREENERKKEYLRSYRRAVKRERDILEEIQRLRLDKILPWSMMGCRTAAVRQICQIT